MYGYAQLYGPMGPSANIARKRSASAFPILRVEHREKAEWTEYASRGTEAPGTFRVQGRHDQPAWAKPGRVLHSSLSAQCFATSHPACGVAFSTTTPRRSQNFALQGGTSEDGRDVRRARRAIHSAAPTVVAGALVATGDENARERQPKGQCLRPAVPPLWNA